MYYNVNHSRLEGDQKALKIRDNIEDIKAVLGRNILLTLDMQDTELEKIAARSSSLMADAEIFHKTTKSAKKTVARKRRIRNCLYALGGLAGIYVVVALKCGWSLTLCHANANKEG